MVGREVETGRRRERTTPLTNVVLKAYNLYAQGDRGLPALNGVSLEVRGGEIVGVAGVAGNGQRELAEALTGMRGLTAGQVSVAGVQLRAGDPRDAIARGVAHVPEDRLGTGVAPSLSIASNTVLKAYRDPDFSAGPFLRRSRIARRASELIARYSVSAPGPETRARDLSGGNLQKVVIGREFAGAPSALVVASPTRGLDVGAIENVHELLRAAAARGVAVLMISEDLDEILALADRVLVMYEGSDRRRARRRGGRRRRARHADGRRGPALMRIERRSSTPRWLQVAVPVGSVAAAFVISAVVLLATGHNPLHAYRRLFEAAFTDPGALSATLTAATPLCFTGLAAAVAFRVGLFNIGAEGQLYMGAIAAAGVALALAGQGTVVQIGAMIVAGGLGGAAWALIPGFLRAFANTNEIITSLMLNYVAALFLNYLIFDTLSYWRDTSSPGAEQFPQGKALPDAASWPTFGLGTSLVIPFGLLVAVVMACVVSVLYKRTRFGFEAAVIGDSPRAARYAGMRTRRNILLVMGLSGLLAGIGGASQDGDFRHLLDPRGLAAARVRLHRDRGRRARALQPVRGPARGVPDRRAEQRRLCPSGRRLPLRPGGRDAGHRPVLRARRRVARPLSRPPRARALPWRRRPRREQQPLRPDRVVRHRLRHAAPVRRARRVAGRALGRAQPGRRGDDAGRGGDGLLRRAATGRAGAVALAAAIAVAALAGAAIASIHAFLVITLRASQIVSGLAITIFAGAAGLSSYLANDLDLAESPARHVFGPILPQSLQDLPVVGPLVFAQTALVYASWVLTGAVAFYLARTRPGLELRAVGEAPGAADAVGINVTAYRYAHTLIGGALAGVGGACFSLSITPQWLDGLTGGAGWIAIALVIFAFWRPDLCLVGAYVFGAFSALPFILQARGVTVAPELFQALPYLMTVVVLVAVSTGAVKRHLGAPAALGQPYVREER